MTTLVKVDELNKITEGLEAFELRKKELSDLAESAKDFGVSTIEDKEAYKQLVEKRKELKAARVLVEKEGKAMRDVITPVSKMISSKEKELVAIIEPEEERLSKNEAWFIAETDRVKAEAEAKEKARIQARMDALNSFNVAIDYIEVLSMTDEQFNARLEAAKIDFQIELDRKAKEEAEAAEAKRIEEERIAAERAELEKLRKEKEEAEKAMQAERDAIAAERKAIQDEKDKIEADKQAAIDAENKRIQDEANRVKREAEIEQAKKDAAKKALEDQKAKEERDRIAAERKAARQPDKAKLEAYILNLESLLTPVALKSEEALNITTEGNKRLAQLITFLKTETSKL